MYTPNPIDSRRLLRGAGIPLLLMLFTGVFLPDAQAATDDHADNASALSLNCPADVTVFVDPGTCCAAVSLDVPTISGATGLVDLTNDNNGEADASGMYFPGDFTVTWTATDEAGQTATCSTTITVIDNEAPVLSMPDPNCETTYQSCIEESNRTVQDAVDALADALAACNGDELCERRAQQSYMQEMEQARKRLAGCLRLDDCEIVPIVGNEMPPITLTTLPGRCGDDVFNAGPIVTDNCSVVELVNDSPFSSRPDGRGFYPIGTWTVTWTATDQFGNSSMVSRTITIKNGNSPTAVCQPVEVELNSDGVGSITAADVDGGSFDDCEDITLSIDQSTFTCDDGSGPQSVTLTATNASGLSSSCVTTVTLSGTDSDCDGVADACDVCPGGDDSIDNNGDGLPDCKYYPGFEFLPESWKCGKNRRNKKVVVCKNGRSICVSENALKGVLRNKAFLGPCGTAGCGTQSTASSLIEFPEDEALRDGFTIAPNPAREVVTIRVANQTAVGEMSLFDQHGRRLSMLTLAPGTQQYDFDLSNIPAGTYILRLQTGTETSVQRLVIVGN